MSVETRPLAVVGLAFRFPGGIDNLSTLRKALQSRRSAIQTVPPSRWSVDYYYSSNPVSKGKSYIRRGGFLTHDISMFDAAFFGISPRDAENMDPQQRLLLEVVWEAFENSGLVLPDYSGREVGVYVGGFMLDHMISQMSASSRSQINQHTAAGMMMTMLSNRISHTFDFRGPSLSIDTACSSSLVAFHYACQDLWNGAAELAVVGGANAMTRPEYPMGMCKGHFLSRDGECKSFDQRGDGYGRGEGAAAVLLKPLEAAQRDGDPILVTVIGTGTNQDGRTPGISMPSRSAQQTLIEQVCQKYRIDPATVAYVECHGTGTAVGDPTESAAVGSIYGQARRGQGPVVVGSIKSNIGHTEAVAGVAGIIKTVLTAVDRRAYPLANLQTPHPDIAFDDLNLRLSDDQIPLPEQFVAAVNSFGYGGSNAHVLLETAPRQLQTCVQENTQRTEDSELVDNGNFNHQMSPGPTEPYMLPISARSQPALKEMAARYAQLLRESNWSLEDLLYSSSHKRAHLSHRAVVAAHSRLGLIEELEQLAGAPAPSMPEPDARDSASANATNSGAAGARAITSGDRVENSVPYEGNLQPVFVFTGMGPQWWAMGQQLYREQPVYRASVEAADRIFTAISGWSILAEMLKDEASSRITTTEYAQPANLLLQIGLLELLQARGIQPGAVVGHSVGELASAYAAGVLTKEKALTVAWHRSRLQAECRGTGGMLAAAVDKSTAWQLIHPYAQRVSIAANNGPTNVTLAGDIDALLEIAEQLTSRGVFNRRLDVEVPYHSPMMDSILEPLGQALSQLQLSEPALPIYSTVTGHRVTGIAYDAQYWQRNVRQSVEFADAIGSLLEDGYRIFIEVGPHPVLSTSLADCTKSAGKECRTLITLRRHQDETTAMHRAIMSLHSVGAPVQWSAIHKAARFVPLPNYPWQRERHWMENERARQDRISIVEHPILGIQEAPGAPHYRNDFDHEPMMYLKDHVVTGTPVLPAAAYVEALLELAQIHHPESQAWIIRDLAIMAPMLLVPERGSDFVTDFDPMTGSVVVRSLDNGRLGFGQTHVTARITAHSFAEDPIDHDVAGWRSELPQALSVQTLYDRLASIGLTYGPAFRTVRELHVDAVEGKMLARIELQPDLACNLHQYRLHPTLLDACFHSLMTMLDNSDATYLPTGLAEISLVSRTSPAVIYCYGERIAQTSRHIDCNLTLVDQHGRLVASIRSMRSTATSRRERTGTRNEEARMQILDFQWRYGDSIDEPKRLGHWLVVAGQSDLAEQIASRLENFGSYVPAIVQWTTLGPHPSRTSAASLEECTELLSQIGELNGVVFLNGLDANTTAADVTGETSIRQLITWTQALLKQNYAVPPRAYVVTRNAFLAADTDQRVEPAQTAINGFTRVAYNELAGFDFSTIDLPERITNGTIDALTMELLADSRSDEVALRGNLRYVNELAESDCLDRDRVTEMPISDDQPIWVRALRPDAESPGTARLLARTLPDIADDHIRIRVESMVVPKDLLLDPTADIIDGPLVEIAGTVTATGSGVQDVAVGDLVCGFAPSDLSSHWSDAREKFALVKIESLADRAALLANLAIETRLQCVLAMLDLAAGTRALIEVNELGLLLADRLVQMGVQVALIGGDPKSTEPASTIGAGLARFPMTQHGLGCAIREMTAGDGFDLLVVAANRWSQRMDWWMIASGGTLVDTDEQASPLMTPEKLGLIVRSDLRILQGRRQLFQRATARAIDRLQDGRLLLSRDTLNVSIVDVAWQKLPLGDFRSSIILNFDSGPRRLPIVQQDRFTFNRHGTYLITGGLGGFGQKTAEWLIDQGVQSMVLTSRTGADTAQRRAFVERLQSSGAKVKVAACDGTDHNAMAKLFDQIAREMPPLVGIYHSAAIIQDETISEMDLKLFSRVMQSKASSAWILHELSKDLPLEQFVMYSSVANQVGNARQSPYSAANGFLNGLVSYRRSLGLCGTSISWGVIGDVGVVAQDEALEQYLRYSGLRGMPARDALEVLKKALARDVAQFGLTMMASWADWARFETRGSKSPRFATLIANDSKVGNSTVRDAIVHELVQLEPNERTELLSALIAEIIAGVLKLEASDLSIDRKIEQLGVDSLMATEIQMLLDTRLGLSVSVLELIGDATIRSLTEQSLRTLVDYQTALTVVGSAS